MIDKAAAAHQRTATDTSAETAERSAASGPAPPTSIMATTPMAAAHATSHAAVAVALPAAVSKGDLRSKRDQAYERYPRERWKI